MELGGRFMRTILFFDLPAVTKRDHREYTKFIKTIKSKGFAMLQESVYTKLSINETTVDATIRDLKRALPPDGSISCLTITEKQFSAIEVLLGEMETDVVMNEDKTIVL